MAIVIKCRCCHRRKPFPFYVLLKALHICYRVSRALAKRLWYYLAPDLLVRITFRHFRFLLILAIFPLVYTRTVGKLLSAARRRLCIFSYGPQWMAQYDRLSREMERALSDPTTDYEQYKKIAEEMDRLDRWTAWKHKTESELYNHKIILSDCIEMRRLLAILRATQPPPPRNAIFRLMCFVRARIDRNYARITRVELYYKSRIGTKSVIEQFIDLLTQSIQVICDYDETVLEPSQKFIFLSELRHVLGRTSLCLSGGAKLGLYHIGVVIELKKKQLLPNIISGSSIGSMVAAYACCIDDFESVNFSKDNYPSLQRGLCDDQHRLFPDALRSYLRTGYLMKSERLRETLRRELGDVTFLELYQRSGKILNVSVSGYENHTAPMLLNFLTSPNVLIWSAIVCSCALPKLFKPQELYLKVVDNTDNTSSIDDEDGDDGSSAGYTLKPVYLFGQKFMDGSLINDLPIQKLQQLFNVNNVVVSQVNPQNIVYHKLFLSFYGDGHSDDWMSTLGQRLLNFITFEFRSLLTNLHKVHIWGMSSSVRTFLFGEHKWFGDVTIFPTRVSMNHIWRCLSNPTRESWLQCTRVGQKSVYKHISRLTILLKVEQCLEDSLKKTKIRLRTRERSDIRSILCEQTNRVRIERSMSEMIDEEGESVQVSPTLSLSQSPATKLRLEQVQVQENEKEKEKERMQTQFRLRISRSSGLKATLSDSNLSMKWNQTGTPRMIAKNPTAFCDMFLR